MAEHDNQTGAQNIDPVLNASEAFIKDDFGWHTRIGITEDDRKRVLTLRQFCASFGGLLASHSQRNRASIFKAVGRYVLSFINRFVRVLQISGGESAIAFFQSRDRLSRGNSWLIWMSRISSFSKLVCTKQTDRDETE